MCWRRCSWEAGPEWKRWALPWWLRATAQARERRAGRWIEPSEKSAQELRSTAPIGSETLRQTILRLRVSRRSGPDSRHSRAAAGGASLPHTLHSILGETAHYSSGEFRQPACAPADRPGAEPASSCSALCRRTDAQPRARSAPVAAIRSGADAWPDAEPLAPESESRGAIQHNIKVDEARPLGDGISRARAGVPWRARWRAERSQQSAREHQRGAAMASSMRRATTAFTNHGCAVNSTGSVS